MFDSTIGGNAATSYLSVADAVAILQSLPQSGAVTDWLALTEQQKEQSLTGATMVLDPLSWKGVVCSCEQRLAWPRQLAGCGCPVSSCGAIPFDIQLACAYLASEVGAFGGGFVGSTGGSTGSSGGRIGGSRFGGSAGGFLRGGLGCRLNGGRCGDGSGSLLGSEAASGRFEKG